MSKSIINLITDILKLFKYLLNDKSKKIETTIFLENILNQLKEYFEISYNLNNTENKQNVKLHEITFGNFTEKITI